MKIYDDILQSLPDNILNKIKIYNNFFNEHVINQSDFALFPIDKKELIPDLYKNIIHCPISSGYYVVSYDLEHEIFCINTFKKINIKILPYHNDKDFAIVFETYIENFESLKSKVEITKKTILINLKEYLFSLDNNINKAQLFNISKKSDSILKNYTKLSNSFCNDIIEGKFNDIDECNELYIITKDSDFSLIEKRYIIKPLFDIFEKVQQLKKIINKNNNSI